jgi:putative molybdopterin biosynthesis protein
MTETVSYTADEVAKILRISRFTVYKMIKRGDLSVYRIGRTMRIEAPELDNYIIKSKAASFEEQLLSEKNSEDLSVAQENIILCGQDVILDVLAVHLGKMMPNIRLFRNSMGSIDGLLALYHKTANAVTCHLWDSDSDTYNLSYVRRLLPGHRTLIINLVYRTEGFYVAKGNPKKILTWHDLTKPNISFVNRECGSGARVLLDEQLHSFNINRHDIHGYEQEELSHLAVASYVARGEADVGLGIEKVALQVRNLDFIPLHKERYDLVIRKEDEKKPQFQALFAVLRSSKFYNEISGMGGYDLSHTGQIMAET